MKFDNLLENIEKNSKSEIHYRTSNNSIAKKSFAEFLLDVESLAQKITALGFGAGDIIGLQAKNSYEWTVLDIATLKLGIVLQVYPEEMVVSCQNVGLKAFVTDRGEPGSFNLTFDWCSVGTAVGINIPSNVPRAKDKDVLSRVYSSGTTGIPKGIEISCRGVESLITTIHECYDITEKDTHIIFLPFSNFQQRMSVYGCLSSGVSFFISNLNTAIQDIKNFGPSFIICPPIFYEIFLLVHIAPADIGNARQLIRAGLGGNIRIMITGMAPIKRSILNRYSELELPIYEVYGTTEIGMIALNIPKANLYGSVGKPIELDSVCLGNDNEIIVKKTWPLSRKYFDAGNGMEDELTSISSGILTGDLGYLQDGYLFLTGRKKDVIITSGGYKFNPFEHEKTLLEIPHLLGCMVLNDHEEDIAALLVLPQGENDQLIGLIKEKIKTINQNSISQKRIINIYATHSRFEDNPHFMTRNMKLNRSAIRDSFLSALYEKEVRGEDSGYWKI